MLESEHALGVADQGGLFKAPEAWVVTHEAHNDPEGALDVHQVEHAVSKLEEASRVAELVAGALIAERLAPHEQRTQQAAHPVLVLLHLASTADVARGFFESRKRTLRAAVNGLLEVVSWESELGNILINLPEGNAVVTTRDEVEVGEDADILLVVLAIVALHGSLLIDLNDARLHEVGPDARAEHRRDTIENEMMQVDELLRAAGFPLLTHDEREVLLILAGTSVFLLIDLGLLSEQFSFLVQVFHHLRDGEGLLSNGVRVVVRMRGHTSFIQVLFNALEVKLL